MEADMEHTHKHVDDKNPAPAPKVPTPEVPGTVADDTTTGMPKNDGKRASDDGMPEADKGR